MISIWFFIGIALTVNGLLIFGAGAYEMSHPPAHPVVLFSKHAPVWWGALLTVIGLIYCVVYRPKKASAAIR
jgi:hypothetical protein